MQTFSSSEARNNFAAMLNAIQREPVAIQKQGKNTAILMSFDEYERLSNDSAQEFFDICERIRKNAKKRGLTEKIFNEIMAETDD